MLSTMLLSMFSATALSLFLAATPLQMGSLILLYAMTAALWFSLITSSWFALMMFMIYIGGMLVMFAYFVAITPNQSLPIKYIMMLFITSFLTLLTQNKMNKEHNSTLSSENPQELMSMLFNPSQGLTLMFLLLMLLLALIMVVKISHRSAGPLRPFKSL